MASGAELAETRTSAVTWDINFLCLMGAGIGALALLFTWLYDPPTMLSPPSPLYTPVLTDFIIRSDWYGTLYLAAAILYLGGTIISFASSLGVFPALGGLVLFAAGIIESGGETPLDGIDQQQRLRAGMYLGILSCALVLSSIYVHLGKNGVRTEGLRPAERFLTVSRRTRPRRLP